MAKEVDITGQKFNMLTALYRVYVQKDKRNVYYMFQCDCGVKKILRKKDVVNGGQVSCGCYARRITSERSKTHGLRDHKLYVIWTSMKQRCNNRSHHAYKNYGGRGISVCDEWQSNFLKFYEWSVSNGYQDGLSIDRIDNDGNYEPNNCRWATVTEQQQNTRATFKITAYGETHCATEWARITGISDTTIKERIKNGLSPEEALKKIDRRRKLA